MHLAASAEDLSLEEALEIEAFLGSLTDRGFAADPRLSLPKVFCGRPRLG